MERTSLKGQGLAGDQNDVSPLISPLHLIVGIVHSGRSCLPLRARRVIQAGRLVRRAADIPGADNAVTVCEGKVEQTPRVHVLGMDRALGNLVDELVNDGNRLEHRLPQNRRTETLSRLRAWVMAHSLQSVQEEGKRPLAVGTTNHAQVPLVG